MSMKDDSPEYEGGYDFESAKHGEIVYILYVRRQNQNKETT